jgi:hypothetical protein
MGRAVVLTPTARRALVVTLAVIVIGAALYGALTYRHRTDIAIDLRTSIDHRVVYPMHKETNIISHPGHVDLLLPNGQEYHEEDPYEVWISRTSAGDRNQIKQISINTLFEMPDQAYARAYRFQEAWGIKRGPALDRWYEQRKRQPLEPEGVDPVLGERWFTDIVQTGRTFSVGFDLRGSSSGEKYQVIEEFNWGYE